MQNSLELGSSNISLGICIVIILLASWTAELASSKSEIWTAGNYCIILSQLLNTTLRYGATVPGTLRQNDIRMILDANFQDNSGMLFTKLDWLLIDDIIRTRRLSLLHKICNGCGPEYLSSYVNYVKSSHDYNRRTSRRNYLITPKCQKKIRPEHSLPVPLVFGTKLNHLLETRFHRNPF